jgi:predicted Zn finger-like uncharacterized protein
MRITCPSCDSSYTIPDDKIGAKGRTVRCASCGTKWLATLADDNSESAIEPSVVVPDQIDLVAIKPVDEQPASPSAGAAGGDTDQSSTAAAAQSAIEAAEEQAKGAAAAAEAAARRDIESAAKKPKIKVAKTKPAKARKPIHFDLDRFLVRARPIFGGLVLAGSLVAIAGAVAFRVPVVAAFPNLASLYQMLGLPVNLRGLVFERVQTLREVDNGQAVLVVEGQLNNPTTQDRPVPAIRFALRGDDKQEIYAWSIDPKVTSLTPGANMRFRSRLASPPDQAADLQVRMIERMNRQASAHD